MVRFRRHKSQAWRAWWQERDNYSFFVVDSLRTAAYGPVDVELLTAVLGTFPVASLSQLISERMWPEKIADRAGYLSTIRDQYSVDADFTQGFDDMAEPSRERTRYAIHVTGRLTLPLVRRIAYFSIDSLGTIAYGLMRRPEPWLDTVVRWNRDLIRWFDRKEGAIAMQRVLGEVPVIVLAIDARLTFVGRDEKALRVAQEYHCAVSERAGLTPIVERRE